MIGVTTEKGKLMVPKKGVESVKESVPSNRWQPERLRDEPTWPPILINIHETEFGKYGCS